MLIMAQFTVKNLLPRGLYGRAALILLVPIITIQLVVSFAFIQRHYLIGSDFMICLATSFATHWRSG